MNDTGIFTISFDTELAWGTQGAPRFRKAYQNTRTVVDDILRMLERHRLSATWAVVGQLFLEPKTDNDIWHAADMVRRIQACPVRQELACHSFMHATHLSSCDEKCFDHDLARCQEVARAWGISFDSFVYPRNIVKYSERLAPHGFRIFRDHDNTWYNHLPGPLAALGHGIDAYCWPFAPVGTIARRGGVLAVPGNQFFVHRQGWARLLPVAFQVSKAMHGLRRAARERKSFHLWTHPFNIATDPVSLLRGFERICAEAARLRDEGILENMTMRDIAHRYG